MAVRRLVEDQDRAARSPRRDGSAPMRRRGTLLEVAGAKTAEGFDRDGRASLPALRKHVFSEISRRLLMLAPQSVWARIDPCLRARILTTRLQLTVRLLNAI